MNYAREAKARLGLTEEEFALLVGVPAMLVNEWEGAEDHCRGALESLFVLLAAHPHGCAEVLVEHRVNTTRVTAPERPLLEALVRKIHACHVA